MLEECGVKRYEVAPPLHSSSISKSNQNEYSNLSLNSSLKSMGSPATPPNPVTPRQASQLLNMMCPATQDQIQTTDAAHVACIRAMGEAIATSHRADDSSRIFQTASGMMQRLHATHDTASQNQGLPHSMHAAHAFPEAQDRRAACMLAQVTPCMVSAAAKDPTTVHASRAEDWAKALCDDPAFENLGPNLLDILLRYCRILSIPAGTVIMSPGQSAKAVFVILSGSVAIESVGGSAVQNSDYRGVPNNFMHGSHASSPNRRPPPQGVSTRGDLRKDLRNDTQGTWTVSSGWCVGGWCVAEGCPAMHAVRVPSSAPASTVTLALSVHDMHACMWQWAFSRFKSGGGVTSEMFQNLPPAVRAAARTHVHLMHVPAGTPICLEGRRPRACVMLVQGEATSCMLHDNATEALERAIHTANSRNSTSRKSSPLKGAEKLHEHSDGSRCSQEPSRRRSVRIIARKSVLSPNPEEELQARYPRYTQDEANRLCVALARCKSNVSRWQLICEELTRLEGAPPINTVLGRQSMFQRVLGPSDASVSELRNQLRNGDKGRLKAAVMVAMADKRAKSLKTTPNSSVPISPASSSIPRALIKLRSAAAFSVGTSFAGFQDGFGAGEDDDDDEWGNFWNVVAVSNHQFGEEMVHAGVLLHSTRFGQSP